MAEFRVLRDGVSIGTGTAKEARAHAKRGDVIQNVQTLEKFSWWPELGGCGGECDYCLGIKRIPQLTRTK